MAERIGQRFGNYQLIRLLGQGGFAEVYLGEHVHLGTQAAIKILYTQLTNDEMDRFRTEARTIARLIHPHIVRVLEFGLEAKTPFLVMDYATKGTLRQRHRKSVALPLATVISYVKQVADALDYAHDKKVIHRDIKPENMLLGEHDQILLSDFGIALVLQSSRYQSMQEMAGTMAYMAPEQIQGKPRPASDQYSLGVVVYEWITGDRPFHGSLTELIGQHLSVPPPSMHEKVSTISSEVDQVVLTALAKDPKQRFTSVKAFANALEQANKPERLDISHSVTVQSESPDLTVPSPSPKAVRIAETPNGLKSQSTLTSSSPSSETAFTVSSPGLFGTRTLPSSASIPKRSRVLRLVGVALAVILTTTIELSVNYQPHWIVIVCFSSMIVLIPLVIVGRIRQVTEHYALIARIFILGLLMFGLIFGTIYDLLLEVFYLWVIIITAFILIERVARVGKRYALITGIFILALLMFGLPLGFIFGAMLTVLYLWLMIFLISFIVL